MAGVNWICASDLRRIVTFTVSSRLGAPRVRRAAPAHSSLPTFQSIEAGILLRTKPLAASGAARRGGARWTDTSEERLGRVDQLPIHSRPALHNRRQSSPQGACGSPATAGRVFLGATRSFPTLHMPVSTTTSVDTLYVECGYRDTDEPGSPGRGRS